MKKFLRISLVVLAIAAIISAFVLSIGASEKKDGYASYTDSEGVAKEDALASAIANAKDGTTVTLHGDCQLLATATIGKNLTVDLGGYKLSSRAATVFNVTEEVSFTVTGTGSIDIGGALYRTAADKGADPLTN